MRHETGTQPPPTPVVSILFRIFTAMHCGAVLLDSGKHVLRLTIELKRTLGRLSQPTRAVFVRRIGAAMPCSKPFWISPSSMANASVTGAARQSGSGGRTSSR
jgi:hypothetical protein